MLYNLSLNLQGVWAMAALAVATVFVFISLTKERNDERKRA